MAVTPRSRTASANSSPTKSNGRKPTRIAIDLSDEDEVEERKPAKGKSRASAAKVQIEVSSDDDNDDESGDEYEVEAIRGHRRAKEHESWKYEYFIKWKNWPEDDNTWEPEENLTSELVDDYWKSQPSKSQPKKFQQKRKALSDDEEEDDDDEEEIKDSDSDQVSVKPKANGRRASSSASRKPTSNRNSPAKKARTSTSGRRRAQSDSEDDEDDEDEDEDSDAADRRKELIAVNKIRDYFREHYIKKNPDWEDLVENIINMAREPKDSQLKSYVQFRQDPNWVRAMSKAGLPNKYAEKGPQMWVPNEIVNERCPQKVIKFYSQHVRFSNPTSNH